MASPIFYPKKEVMKFNESSEDQIGESMVTTVSSKKASTRQKLKEEAPKQQMQEVENQPTLKELQARDWLGSESQPISIEEDLDSLEQLEQGMKGMKRVYGCIV
ncbi:hypothetical protein CQW23_27306 [Capsicum baccatum]|uniref:Uncharacterized protein n=1 Tax=Capsicum baccatum TaxID=33114 RepID=A0A2G2VDG0_CAPBA|nr:hypothetical protein CQW23_27306 [Capsicum baccatum]